MNTLSTDSYKGTRDYFPEDKRLQNYVFDTWKHTVMKFGYEEYGAPLLEPASIYAAKSGDELVNEQTYRFTDRGDREVVIRPEMTPSISRMVAARRQELAYPARLFSIANFMRYERPQRGREREFWQLNVDLFGADGVEADIEIISLAHAVMEAFNADESMYVIKLNHRGLIDVMMTDFLQLDPIQSQLMAKLFDRRTKISNEEFRDQAIGIFGDNDAPSGLARIAELLLAKDFDKLPESLKDSQPAKELKEVITTLKNRGVANIAFDITLMRGFDYYTGIVFEVFDTAPENNRAMFGGGRYDGLVGLFGAEPVSAVGMAPGLSTMELFLKTHNLLPLSESTTEAYMVVLDAELISEAQKLARRFREEGVRIEVDFTGRKIDKQIKTALKKKIPYMLFVGAEDLKKETFNFKNTHTSDENRLSFERIVALIKDRRTKPASSDDLFG